MATKKSFWYVLVMTNSGPVFVTSIDYHTKTAHWDKNEKPLELGAYKAEDLAFGLICNFHTAFPVKSPIEWENQPYRYEFGEFKWEEKKKEE